MIACLYYGIIYQDAGMLTVLFAIGMLVALSFVELISRFFTLRCNLQVPIAMVDKGQKARIQIVMKNTGLFPVGKVFVRLRIKNVLKGDEQRIWHMIPGVRRAKSIHEIFWEAEDSGAFEVRLEKIRIQGIFGFMFITRKSKAFAFFSVLPQIHSMGIEVKSSTKNFQGDADVFDEFRSGSDPTETFEIREYREKDKLQNIHWKLSARVDDLMVIENSLPKPCSIILMIDTRAQGKLKAEADMFLEVLASISFRLMDLKTPHFVTWLSRETADVRRIRVDNEESYYLFLTHFLCDIDTQSKRNIREAYREKFRNEIYLHDVMMTLGLELYKDGDLVTKWKMKEIKSVEDECGKLELLL